VYQTISGFRLVAIEEGRLVATGGESKSFSRDECCMQPLQSGSQLRVTIAADDLSYQFNFDGDNNELENVITITIIITIIILSPSSSLHLQAMMIVPLQNAAPLHDLQFQINFREA